VHVSNRHHQFLEGGPFAPVDHPKIADLANRLTADRDGSWNRASAVYEWVFENIEKKAVVSVPSALEVLEAMEGDCNEHTLLYTALARAAGVPTRVAIGLVWSEELNGFYYHAWPEVFVGEWIWIETKMGRIKQILSLDPDLDPRVVCTAFGWWFPEEPEELYQFRKSNVNMLTDSDPPYDPHISTPELRAIPCRITSM